MSTFIFQNTKNKGMIKLVDSETGESQMFCGTPEQAEEFKKQIMEDGMVTPEHTHDSDAA